MGKLAMPGRSGLAVGATAENGKAAVDNRTARRLDMTEDLFDATFARELKALRGRAARLPRRPAADRCRWACRGCRPRSR